MAIIIWISIIPLQVLLVFTSWKVFSPQRTALWQWVAEWFWVWSVINWMIFVAEIVCIIFLLQGEVKRKEKFFIIFTSLNGLFRSGLGFLLLIIAQAMANISGVG